MDPPGPTEPICGPDENRPWTRASLREVGGARGIGVRFLQEAFSSRTAVPEHRVLEKPILDVLQAFLPERSSDLSGRVRSRRELAGVCGMPAESERFARL